MAFKDYRDPLYGFISATKEEQQLIDTDFFQRLRYIKQLGTSFLVYPTSNHTRFEHSLGTMEVVTQLFDAVTSRFESKEILEWDNDTFTLSRKLLRYAALLHDIGHAPFSHASEELFPTEMDHEDYTFNIITSTGISNVIDSELGKGAALRVAQIATGVPKNKNDSFLTELLTGEFGADRLDYLLRDSYHLGVSYGKFDLFRLLNTMQLRLSAEKEGPELVIEAGGIHTIEGFLLARYFMFLEVYFHKTRRILDYHLTEFLKSRLSEGKYPASLEEFTKWDDNRVLSIAKEGPVDEKMLRLLNRHHYRKIFETVDHPDLSEMERFDWMLDRVKGKFDEKLLFYDEAKKSPYNFSEPLIFVDWQDEYVPIAKCSPMIAGLRKINKIRLYADLSIREKTEDFCKEFWRTRQGRRG